MELEINGFVYETSGPIGPTYDSPARTNITYDTGPIVDEPVIIERPKKPDEGTPGDAKA